MLILVSVLLEWAYKNNEWINENRSSSSRQWEGIQGNAILRYTHARKETSLWDLWTKWGDCAAQTPLPTSTTWDMWNLVQYNPVLMKSPAVPHNKQEVLTDCVQIAVYEMNSRWERSNMHPLVDLQITMLHLKIWSTLVLKRNLLYCATWKWEVGGSRVEG